MSSLQLSAEDIRLHLKNIELPTRRKGMLGSYADEIVRYGAFVGSSIECYPHLERAMDHGRSYIDATEKSGRSVKSGRIILAEKLTGSKGRFTRSWHAPEGGLWGCLVHANTLMPQSAMLLSFAVGVAACETLREFSADQAWLRWVNDVLINGEKAAGFLIEGHTGPKWGEQYHLIGFGINVNNSDFPSEIQNIATSLNKQLAKAVDLRNFSLSFICKLAWNIGLLYFIEAKKTQWWVDGVAELHPLISRWMELSDTVGKRVVFGYDVVERPQYSAEVSGVAADGGLKLILDDGLEIVEHCGEIRYL